MQRRLPIVETPFGQNADKIIGVQINRISVGRHGVVLESSQHPPWTGSEKVLPAYGAERGLEARITDYARGGQNLFGVGRPDNAEFGLAVHETLSPYRGWC